MKLYEIAGEYLELMALDDGSEDMKQAIADTLEGIEAEFEEKAKSVVMYRKNIESDVAALDDEIKRLSARKSALKNRVDGLTSYLRLQMEAVGKKKVDTGLFTISLLAGRESVAVLDPESLPDSVVVVERKPNKTEIGKLLKAGSTVPGAELVTGSPSVRIS